MGEHPGDGKFLKANLGKVEVKKAWAAECFRPAPAARVCVRLCLSLRGRGMQGEEGLLRKRYALSGTQGLELRGPSLPGAPRLPKAVGAPCFCLPFAGQCDLTGRDVGSGARLLGTRSQLCHWLTA